MKIKIETAKDGNITTSFAEVQPRGADYRMPMKKAAIAAMKANGCGTAEVYVEQGGEWKTIMSVWPASQPGQWTDTFNQVV